MDTQEILNLQEAYLNVYSSHELDEEEADRLRDRRAEAGAHWPGGNDPLPRRPSSGTVRPQTTAKKQNNAFASVVADLKTKYGDDAIISSTRTRKPGGSVSEATTREQYDLYDIILSHLLDEGYAETIESAEAIMVNMSEDWREDIVEKFISPFKGRVSYNNPQGLSPAMKAGHKSDELQRTEPGSKRQIKQTLRSQQLDRMYHAAKTAHLR